MATYDLNGSVLCVEGNLSGDEDHRLSDWCRKLMESGGDTVTLDLSAVKMVTSSCVGVLSAVWVDMVTQDRMLEVIVSAEVRRVFTLAGFHQVFKLLDPKDDE